MCKNFFAKTSLAGVDIIMQSFGRFKTSNFYFY